VLEKTYAVLAHTDPRLVKLYRILVKNFLGSAQLAGFEGSFEPSKSTMLFEGAWGNVLSVGCSCEELFSWIEDSDIVVCACRVFVSC
jgi:hypothetical protein